MFLKQLTGSTRQGCTSLTSTSLNINPSFTSTSVRISKCKASLLWLDLQAAQGRLSRVTQSPHNGGLVSKQAHLKVAWRWHTWPGLMQESAAVLELMLVLAADLGNVSGPVVGRHLPRAVYLQSLHTPVSILWMQLLPLLQLLQEVLANYQKTN